METQVHLYVKPCGFSCSAKSSNISESNSAEDIITLIINQCNHSSGQTDEGPNQDKLSPSMREIYLLFAVGDPLNKVGAEIPSQELDAFISDRVVEVRILMPEEIWRNMQARASKEHFVLATFRYDGELVPDVAVRAEGSSSFKYVV